MKRHFKAAAAVLCAFAVSQAAFAIDGREVMQMVRDVKKPTYTHTLVQMDLIDKNGQTESRVIEEYSKSENGGSSVVIIFRSPASVRDTRFLQVQNKGRSDDQWIYLPALRNTRRIAASEGDKSFMGTDATYDDMGSRELDEDTHELIEEKNVNGYDCYVVKSTPVDPKSSQYMYRVVSVDKATLLPVFTQMYDKKGALLKELTVEQIRNVDGYDTPIVTTLKNVQTEHSTRITITNMEVDKPVPDKVFTQNFLSTGRI